MVTFLTGLLKRFTGKASPTPRLVPSSSSVSPSPTAPGQLWHDELDGRNWRDYPELMEIWKVTLEDKNDEALYKLAHSAKELDDFDWIYAWTIYVHAKKRDLKAAQKSLAQGLDRAKIKSKIMSDFACELHLAGGDLSESIRWWCLSSTLQIQAKRWTTHNPFLYLSYVARTLGDSSTSVKLLQISDRISGSDRLRLNDVGIRNLGDGVSKLPKDKRQQIAETLVRLACAS